MWVLDIARMMDGMAIGPRLMVFAVFALVGYLGILFLKVLIDRFRFWLLGAGVVLIFGYWIYQGVRG